MLARVMLPPYGMLNLIKLNTKDAAMQRPPNAIAFVLVVLFLLETQIIKATTARRAIAMIEIVLSKAVSGLMSPKSNKRFIKYSFGGG